MINEIVSVLLDVSGSYVVGKLKNIPDRFIYLTNPVQLTYNGPGNYTMSKFAVIDKEIAIPVVNALAFGPLPEDIVTKYKEVVSN
jgi:hypothetical protein